MKKTATIDFILPQSFQGILLHFSYPFARHSSFCVVNSLKSEQLIGVYYIEKLA